MTLPLQGCVASVYGVIECNFFETDFASFPESVIVTLLHLMGLEYCYVCVVTGPHILVPALLDQIFLMFPHLLSLEDTPVIANLLGCPPVWLLKWVDTGFQHLMAKNVVLRGWSWSWWKLAISRVQEELKNDILFYSYCVLKRCLMSHTIFSSSTETKTGYCLLNERMIKNVTWVRSKHCNSKSMVPLALSSFSGIIHRCIGLKHLLYKMQ